MLFADVIERHLSIVLFNGFDIETDRSKAVVAADHCAVWVLHPAVKEVALAPCKRFHKLTHSLPSLQTQALGTFAVNAYPHLAFAHIAGVFNGVLVQRHKVVVLHFSDGCNFYFFHTLRRKHLILFWVRCMYYCLCESIKSMIEGRSDGLNQPVEVSRRNQVSWRLA